MAAIHKKADLVQAPCIAVDTQKALNITAPDYQYENLSLAMASVEYLCSQAQDTLSRRMKRCFMLRFLPGRFQMQEWNGRQMVFDVAHNQMGVSACLAWYKEQFPDQRPALCLGFK